MLRNIPTLSIATDFVGSSGSPEDSLSKIAHTGFTHVHWCHHSTSDFIYTAPEIRQIKYWLQRYALTLLDLHGPTGTEKNWLSPIEYQRQAGVELVINRLYMTSELGGRAVVMHVPNEPQDQKQNRLFWDRLYWTIADLEPYIRKTKVRIALENHAEHYPDDNHSTIKRLLDLYDESLLGVCYDSGHGHRMGNGLDFLNDIKHRLIAMHLNDNDGSADHHMPLFSGTLNWHKTARLIAASSYKGPVSLEIQMHKFKNTEEKVFLEGVYDGGIMFSEMLEHERMLQLPKEYD